MKHYRVVYSLNGNFFTLANNELYEELADAKKIERKLSKQGYKVRIVTETK
jgi:hypothetical protein